MLTGTLGDVGCFSLQFNKIITAGEGGMVISSDEQVWKRAIMYHDVIGGLRNEIQRQEIVWGVNFRMPELLAAVMLVQLRRLDGLLDAMRERKRLLKGGLEAVARRKGITFREIVDPAGDTAIAMIFYAQSPAAAHKISQALQAENIDAHVMYSPDRADYHIYRY